MQATKADTIAGLPSWAMPFLIIAGAFVVAIVGFMVVAVVSPESLAPPPSAQPRAVGGGGAPSEGSTPAREVAPAADGARLLADAKSALADNYRLNKDPMKTTWGRVSEAKRLLAEIPQGAKEYPEAQRLMKETLRRESEIERLTKIAARQLVVEQMEKRMLSAGHDFSFTLSGSEKKVLTVKYVLMSRPLVYQVTNESDFLSSLRDAGFTKVIFTDGYYERWSFDL